MKRDKCDEYVIEEVNGQAVIVRCRTKRRGHDIRVPGMLQERRVVGVADRAFKGCGMRRIELPESLLTLGAGVFSNCRLLEEVVIPTGVERIGYGLFEGSPRLARVVYQGTAPSRTSLESSINFEGVTVTHHIESGDYEAWYSCRLLALSV